MICDLLICLMSSMQIFEDPIAYVHDFVVAPGRMLSGRGNVLVYLNNMIFHVVKSKLMLQICFTIIFPLLVILLVYSIIVLKDKHIWTIFVNALSGLEMEIPM